MPSARECDSPFFLGVHLANPFTAPALLGGGFIKTMKKRFEQIVETVAAAYGEPPMRLLSDSRNRTLARMRAVVCEVLVNRGVSCRAIALYLKKSRPTVSNALRLASTFYASPHSYAMELNLIATLSQGVDTVLPPKEKKVLTCRDCGKYPCFKGIENFETNFALTCLDFRKK